MSHDTRIREWPEQFTVEKSWPRRRACLMLLATECESVMAALRAR